MIYLLPLNRFVVDYQIAKGRSYSVFEKSVLAAIGKGAESIETLKEIFCVHPRIILEALVTLTQAGWVSIGIAKDANFSLTLSGEIASRFDRKPRSKFMEDRSQWIIHEGLTGQVARMGELRLIEEEKLNALSQIGTKISSAHNTPRLGHSNVDGLLIRGEGEWLTRINAIRLRSKNRHWLPIEYNKNANAFVENFPWYWREKLLPHLYSLAKRDGVVSKTTNYISFSENFTSLNGIPTKNTSVDKQRLDGSFPLTLNYNSFLTKNIDHEKYLRRALIKSENFLLVASAFLRADLIEKYDDLILDALKRGVSIDFLWGYNDGSEDGEGIEALKKIAFSCKSQGLRGQLNFNTERTNSHSKITIFDVDGETEASIGSYNWLSAKEDDGTAPRLANVSLIFKDLRPISKLMRTFSTLWGSEGHYLKGVSSRWENLASRLEEQYRSQLHSNEISDETSTAYLLLDDEHSDWLNSVLTGSIENITVLSHKLGPASQKRLSQNYSSPANGEDNPLVKRFVFSESAVANDVLDTLMTEFTEHGWNSKKHEKMHSKLTIADGKLCIGSYNFLSTDAYDRAKLGKEISIIIESSKFAKYINSYISEEFFNEVET